MTNSDTRYTEGLVREQDGSIRRVYVPSEELAREQDDVLRRMRRARVERYMPHAHGGVRGKSTLTNAVAHQGGEEFYKLDLWHAYPSVQTEHLKKMATVALTHLTEIAGPLEVDNIIDTTVTAPGIEGLPTGFATSPMFFNVYNLLLDTQLSTISQESGVVYTRYIDDLTFSGPKGVFASKALRRKIRTTIASQPGGSIRHSKSSIETMQRGVTITGITLTSDPEYIYPAKELLQAVDTYITFCESKAAAGQRLTEHELERLHGYNSVLHMAGHPEDSKSKYVIQLYERYQGVSVRY